MYPFLALASDPGGARLTMTKAMRTLSDAEVKENLSAVLDEVAQGAESAITRQGKEVARLVPSEQPPISREEFLRRAAEIRARQPLNSTRAEDLVREQTARNIGVSLWDNA